MLEISRQEKEKFIQKFGEDEFRERIVRRLFTALKFRDGRDTCGPEEYGKDAIFVETDKLGVDNIIAIQTKTGNINMSGDPSNNIHSLVAQLQTALKQPHVCVQSKRRVLPSAVYAVASGRINQAARSYIESQLNDARLRFLDRDDLISKIDEICPELWAGIISDISPYLRALASRVEDLSISTDANLVHSSIGAYAAASDGRYIDVKLSYQTSKLIKRSGKTVEDFDFEEKSGTVVLSGNAVRALLLGDAGSGKTTLLIRLAYLVAKKSINSTENYRVPVFARAHELVGLDGSSIFSTLESIVMKLHGVDKVPFTVDDLSNGRVVLLIDGLDELANAVDRQDVIDFANRFIHEYPKSSIAIATRPYTSISQIEGIAKFKRYRISPLSIRDVEKLLDFSADKEKTESKEWKREILRKLDNVHGIELNPLLVVVFSVSSGLEKRDIPANITELFAKFTELMLGRWDEKKGISQQYQARVKEYLLAAFAFQLQSRGESRFLREAFVDFCSQRLSEMNLLADLETITNEIIYRSGLLRGDEEIEFKHHLLQEYFASKGIPNLEHVKKVISDEWWRNSIVFYFGAQPDSINNLLEIVTDGATSAEMTYLTIGLAVQACYLSRLDDRVEVWKWVVDGASKAIGSELSQPNEQYPVTAFLTKYLEGRDCVALVGVDKDSAGASQWALEEGCIAPEQAELRRFWYAVALLELGRFDQLQRLLRDRPLANDMLVTAIHLGCHFALHVRSISSESRGAAEAIMSMLDSRVASLRHVITKELRGQLLEYRKGGVVALDEEDPCDYSETSTD
ncbi:NACHT domain-containing protein [Xanthomonadaceae bacterium XH05]|nr:NACHT domain-containing protein [Xanthomonadaceae bacterium XH05]